MGTLSQLRAELKQLADPERAKNSARFFKTGPGDYGEGDTFYGIRVPVLRQNAVRYRHLQLSDLKTLIASPIHEERLMALIILVWQFEHADAKSQADIFDFYLKQSAHINNWDLVDTSTPQIVGGYIFHTKDRRILYRLVKSKSLWERRMSILATFYFIGEGEFDDALAIAEQLLLDKHDLIHKAVGWMLREVGKRDEKILRHFLDKHASIMPRTMLRYAIERLSERNRKHYLFQKAVK